MSINYQATSRQSRWLAGARVVLNLNIENRSSQLFTTPDPGYRNSPQPVFEITPPAGKSITFRPSANAEESDQDREVTMLQIPPGQNWEGDFPLSDFADLNRPGLYRVRSWIEQGSNRVESAAASFEIVAATVKHVATECSRTDDGISVVECLQLLEGGLVASSIVDEIDARNAELLPLHRLERGAAESNAASLLAPYANFAVGLSELRWIVTERNNAITVGHNLTAKRIPLFDSAALKLIFPPVATQAGLSLAAVHGTELQLINVSGSTQNVTAGFARTLTQLDSVPAGGATALSPVAAGNQFLLAMVWRTDRGTRIRFLMVNPDGKLIGQSEASVEGWHPTGAMAAGWSTSNVLHASFTAQAMADPRELSCFEFRLRPDVTDPAAPQQSAAVKLESSLEDVHLAYFESMPGQLSRMVLVRTKSEKMWVFQNGETPRVPHSKLPVGGPITLLPGRLFWYAAWPSEAGLEVNPL